MFSSSSLRRQRRLFLALAALLSLLGLQQGAETRSANAIAAAGPSAITSGVPSSGSMTDRSCSPTRRRVSSPEEEVRLTQGASASAKMDWILEEASVIEGKMQHLPTKLLQADPLRKLR